MACGPALAGVGYLLMLGSEVPVNYWTQLMPGILLFALGLSATVAPLTAAILGSVSEQQAGIGSAVNNAVSRVAGLIGIAMVGLVVGGKLELDGFHRMLAVTAVLLILGGIVSAVGIRDPRKRLGAGPDRMPPRKTRGATGFSDLTDRGSE
jgi:formate hydrogenlyase subunit 3/multisubunit Na+/H+ antiporter MnhD subunit